MWLRHARHQAQDPVLPENVQPVVLQPTVTLEAPAQLARAAHMTPLTAQYEHFLVGDDTRWVRVDAQPLGNSSFVHLDALVNVGGIWERRRLPGPVFELHISNIHRREAVYRRSLMSPAVTGVIAGLGAAGYRYAVLALAERLEAGD